MFSKKLGIGIALLLVFLTAVAFMMGRPDHRDKRVYPIVREYEPFVIENGIKGLKILRKDDPDFKEEPGAINFYGRLEYLEREWAKRHLRLDGKSLKILDDNGTVKANVELMNEKEIEFVKNYYGVGS